MMGANVLNTARSSLVYLMLLQANQLPDNAILPQT
jgi:hypothetical protein